jgi:hypothetical protein
MESGPANETTNDDLDAGERVTDWLIAVLAAAIAAMLLWGCASRPTARSAGSPTPSPVGASWSRDRAGRSPLGTSLLVRLAFSTLTPTVEDSVLSRALAPTGSRDELCAGGMTSGGEGIPPGGAPDRAGLPA